MEQQITIDDGQCLEVAFTNTMCIRVCVPFGSNVFFVVAVVAWFS